MASILQHSSSMIQTQQPKNPQGRSDEDEHIQGKTYSCAIDIQSLC